MVQPRPSAGLTDTVSSGALWCLRRLVLVECSLFPWASGWEPRGLGWTGSVRPCFLSWGPTPLVHLLLNHRHGCSGSEVKHTLAVSGRKNMAGVFYDHVSCPSVAARGGVLKWSPWICRGHVVVL